MDAGLGNLPFYTVKCAQYSPLPEYNRANAKGHLQLANDIESKNQFYAQARKLQEVFHLHA